MGGMGVLTENDLEQQLQGAVLYASEPLLVFGGEIIELRVSANRDLVREPR